MNALIELSFSFFFGLLSLEVGLDGFVLGVEVSHVNDEVFEDEHMSERCDEGGSAEIVVDLSDAGEGVEAVAVHCA